MLIIGAGPAGLAVGASLSRTGMAAVLLEQADEVGASWGKHYERLHLHTNKSLSTLPFVSFPKNYPRYPSRFQILEYLQKYARRFELDIRLNHRVVTAGRSDGLWEVETTRTRFRSRNLVVATGYNCKPLIPRWPGQDSYTGTILHSSAYRNGEPFRGRKALVVGFGNSGGEIAIDLREHGAQSSIAVRSPVNVIPREVLGIPILRIIALTAWLPPRVADAVNAPFLRAIVGDLGRYGLKRMAHGPMSQVRREARIPLIDVGTLALIGKGSLRVHPGIERFTEDGIVFADGSKEDFDAVILATGYRPHVDSFLHEAAGCLDAEGKPLSSGREAAAAGLYFCGFSVTPTGMLREIAREALNISAAIMRRVPTRTLH